MIREILWHINLSGMDYAEIASNLKVLTNKSLFLIHTESTTIVKSQVILPSYADSETRKAKTGELEGHFFSSS